MLKNTAALDYYLKGNYLQNTWDFNEGKNILANFENAIAIDPKFIKAYIGLCNGYTWLGSTGHIDPNEAHVKVDFCINKVLELDKNLPDVYLLIAGKNFWIEWNLQSAIDNINKALQLKPSYPEALSYKGLFLAANGQVEESLDYFFQSERLNPYDNQINSGIGMIYNLTNDNIKALEYVNKNIEICPFWYAQYITQIEALCKLNRFKEAWSVIERLSNDPNSPLSIAELQGYYFASQGKKEEALQQIKIMEDNLENFPLAGVTLSAFISALYLKLGENEKALDYLEFGMEHRSTPLLFIKIDSLWDGLRDHPRYLNAIKNIKYSDSGQKQDEVSKKYKKSSLSRVQVRHFENELKNVMVKDKPWLNPTLNLSDLAESVNMSTNLLSQLLNEYIGKKFYDFVNAYRLEHFLNLLKGPKYKQFTLLSVAYECGFNSKTTFNAFFKKKMGTTPSEYFKE